jgi:REP element-mobilizing transposase RayT
MPIAEPVPRYDPRRHRRRSIRLPHHDYAGGVYFVTVCTHGRVHLFGEIAGGAMIPNAAGDIVHRCWDAIPDHFPRVIVDAFVVMPNHIHGIVGITDGPATNDGADRDRSTACRAPTRRFGGPVAGTLPTVVGAFKSAVTRRINAMRGTPGGAVWQRNYYERVIRDERALHIARRYVRDNPARWHRDRCNRVRR